MAAKGVDVESAIKGSEEAKVKNWYNSYLGRTGRQEEAAFWIVKMNNAGIDAHSEIMNSDEAKKYKQGMQNSVVTPNNDTNKNSPVPGAAAVGYTGGGYMMPSQLTTRSVQENETVGGQINSLLDENSAYIQGNRDRAMRAANARGLVNSTMAASAGEEAALNAAMPIAQADAGVYGKAADYNTALQNQAGMFNADTYNKFASQRIGIDADMAAQRMQIDADLQGRKMGIDAEVANSQAERDSRMSIATMQKDADFIRAQMSDATSRYNTDQSYRTNIDARTADLVNNIVNSTEFDPNIKARLLRELGRTDLADAIHIVEDATDELRTPYRTPGWDGHEGN